MIDLTTEKLISIATAAKICGVTTRCVYGWMAREVNPLESLKFGGKAMTSREALQRFGSRGNAADQQSVEERPSVKMSPSASERREAAKRELRERHGMKVS
jgi:hypothetical protein